MKKLLIAALFVVAAAGSAFAMDGTKVSRQLKTSFEILFPRASNATWEQSEDFMSVSFTLDDENLSAFFSKDGELIGTTKKVELSDLPSKAVKKIRKEYPTFKITDSIEFTQNETSNFYVMVEDGNRKQILEVTAYGNVCVFKGRIK